MSHALLLTLKIKKKKGKLLVELNIKMMYLRYFYSINDFNERQ